MAKVRARGAQFVPGPRNTDQLIETFVASTRRELRARRHDIDRVFAESGREGVARFLAIVLRNVADVVEQSG